MLLRDLTKLSGWFIASHAARISEEPLSLLIAGQQLAFYRMKGKVVAVEDRCPHRNVPISRGKNHGETIQCGYHGWEFDSKGHCVRIPGMVGEIPEPRPHLKNFPVFEKDNFVWVYVGADAPEGQPYAWRHLGEDGYVNFFYDYRFKGDLVSTAENILDVPHTAFLHKGLFRSGASNRIEVEVRRGSGMVEAEYMGEPRPEGIMGRLLAPGGGDVVHVDRFVSPCVAEVEYRLGEHRHILVASALTPISTEETHMYAMAAFRVPKVLAPILQLFKPIALKVVAQDAEMLALQKENLERFGKPQLRSTYLDVLGTEISRLVHGENRDQEGEIQVLRRVEMEI